jgi:hypothetical protein
MFDILLILDKYGFIYPDYDKFGVWCIGSMLALGARGTGFNSLHPDHKEYMS